MNPQTGKWVILSGIIIVLPGIIIYFFHDKTPLAGPAPGQYQAGKRKYPVLFPRNYPDHYKHIPHPHHKHL